MFSFFEYFDINFITSLVTGEITPNVRCINVCPDLDVNVKINQHDYCEFNDYLKKLSSFYSSVFINGHDILPLLRPFWSFIKLKNLNGINDYVANVYIPFDIQNTKKIKNYLEYFENENEDFVYELYNRKIGSLSKYLNEYIQNIYELDKNELRYFLIKKILDKENTNELSNIRLAIVDCADNNFIKDVYIYDEYLTYIECKALLAFYSGCIVKTYNNNIENIYLFIGIGNYDQNNLIDSNEMLLMSDFDLDNQYIADVFMFTSESFKTNNIHTFRINCGVTLREMFCQKNRLNIKTVTKSKIKEKDCNGYILKALKYKRTQEIICRLGNFSSDFDWSFIRNDSNFTMRLTGDTLSISLDALQILFNLVGDYRPKNFYHENFVNYHDSLKEICEYDSSKKFLSKFVNYKFAFPSGMSAFYCSDDHLFYYSNNNYSGDGFINNHIAVNSVGNNLFSTIFSPFSYTQLLFGYLRKFISDNFYNLFNKSVSSNLGGSYYTHDLSTNFHNVNWKCADKFLKIDDLVGHVLFSSFGDEKKKISSSIIKILGDGLSLPVLAYRKILVNNNIFILSLNSNLYSTGFYSFKDKFKLFVDGSFRTFDISMLLASFNVDYKFVMIMSGELFGGYCGIQTSETSYLIHGYKHKLFASYFSPIDFNVRSLNSLFYTYSKNLDILFNKTIFGKRNEFIFSLVCNFINDDIKDSIYILPRLEIDYHNYDTLTNPIHGFSSGCQRLYIISKQKLNSFFVNENNLKKYYLCSMFSFNHLEVFVTRKFNIFNYFNYFGAIGFEYGMHFAFPGIIPDINGFLHMKCHCVISNNIDLQLVFSLLTSPCLMSEFTNKLFKFVFFGIHLNFVPYE